TSREVIWVRRAAYSSSRSGGELERAVVCRAQAALGDENGPDLGRVLVGRVDARDARGLAAGERVAAGGGLGVGARQFQAPAERVHRALKDRLVPGRQAGAARVPRGEEGAESGEAPL